MHAQASWYRSTAEGGRRRLFPHGIVAAFAFAMVLVGWLALPQQKLHEELANAAETDPLTIAYLTAWSSAEPGNWRLQLTLAHHRMLLGQDAAAMYTLASILREGPAELAPPAHKLRLALLERTAYALPDGDPRREQLLVEARAELEHVARHTTDPIELEALLRRAQSLDAPAIVAKLIERMPSPEAWTQRLAAEGRASAAVRRSVEDLARTAIGLGDFALAAKLYWRAYDESRDPSRRLELLDLVAKAERSGNRLPEFFVALEQRLSGLALDTKRYERLARLALAANRTDLAEVFARRMLRFSQRPATRQQASPNGMLTPATSPQGQLLAWVGTFVGALLPSAHAGELYDSGDREWQRPRKASAAPAVPVTRPENDTIDPLSEVIAAALARDRSKKSEDPATVVIVTPAASAVETPAPPPMVDVTRVAPPILVVRDLEYPPPEAARELAARTLEHKAASGHHASDSPRLAGDRLPTATAPKAERSGDVRAARAASAHGPVGSIEWSTAITRSHSFPDDVPNLPFEEGPYALAFEVFLARQNTDLAWVVAHRAVEQRPEDLAWRKRLAEVSEWSQRPSVALQQWLEIAGSTGDETAWGNVHRLAVGLRDEHALLAFLRHRLPRETDPTQTIEAIAAAYERLGEPLTAVAFLQQRLGPPGTPVNEMLHERIAEIAERMTDQNLKLQALRAATREFGPTPARAARMATVHFDEGRHAEAYDVLLEARALAADRSAYGPDDEKRLRFWENTTELAQLLGREADAIDGFRQLLALDVYEIDTIDSLARLLQFRSPEAAAAVLEHGWQRFEHPAHAQRALELWLQASAPERSDALLERLPEAMRNRLLADVGFLRHRANALQALGRFDEARADLLTVARLAPDDLRNHAALMWLFIAHRDAPRLRAAIAWARPLAPGEPDLWGPMGAGLLALDEPDDALKYFVWQARAQRDYLWWLAYADALAAVGRTDAAWQLRDRAWRELRSTVPKVADAAPQTRDRVVALALQFAPGDEARRLLSSLLQDRRARTATSRPPSPVDTTHRSEESLVPDLERLARAPDGPALAVALQPLHLAAKTAPDATAGLEAQQTRNETAAARATANELAVSYLISREEVDSARGWLLSRYAGDLAQPAWARLSIALTDDDRAEIDHLLATLPDWLPKLDRVEALSRNGRHAEAQSAVFDTFAERPHSDPAHQRFVDTMIGDGVSAGLGFTSTTQGPLDGSRWRTDGGFRIDQHMRGWVFAEQGRMRANDPTALGVFDQASRAVGVGLRWERAEGIWRGEIARHEGFADRTAARMDFTRRFGPSLEVGASAGLRQPATESPALSAAGTRDEIGMRATLNLGSRDYLGTSIEQLRFRTQLGTAVGGGTRGSFEYGHRLRLDYPDVTLRAQIGFADYSRYNSSDPIIDRLTPSGSSNPVANFVPSSSTQLNLFTTVGETVRDSYSRSVRPFGEIGLHVNSETGFGYTFKSGLSASLLGSDRFTLFGAWTSATPGNPRGSRELGVAWRLHY